MNSISRFGSLLSSEVFNISGRFYKLVDLENDDFRSRRSLLDGVLTY